MTVDDVMALAPVIPVLVIDDVTKARPLAEALIAGGLRALEVTLRTDCALDAIAEMAKVEGAVVGAGTVLSEAQLDAAIGAGARFIVSPGLTQQLGEAARRRQVPFLPGVATASEVMRALEMGFTSLKFFPAEASGGVAAVRALAAPFGHVRFCPTGGVTLTNASDYLAIASVACVGGSWIAPPGESNWSAVTQRACAVAVLRKKEPETAGSMGTSPVQRDWDVLPPQHPDEFKPIS